MAQMRDDDPGMHVWINFYNSLMDSKICEKMITVSLEGEPSIPARIDAFRRVFEDCAGKGENALVTMGGGLLLYKFRDCIKPEPAKWFGVPSYDTICYISRSGRNPFLIWFVFWGGGVWRVPSC